jgi:hypothetical protein
MRLISNFRQSTRSFSCLFYVKRLTFDMPFTIPCQFFALFAFIKQKNIPPDFLSHSLSLTSAIFVCSALVRVDRSPLHHFFLSLVKLFFDRFDRPVTRRTLKGHSLSPATSFTFKSSKASLPLQPSTSPP